MNGLQRKNDGSRRKLRRRGSVSRLKLKQNGNVSLRKSANKRKRLRKNDCELKLRLRGSA